MTNKRLVRMVDGFMRRVLQTVAAAEKIFKLSICLDEPTSNQDNLNKGAVLRAPERERAGKTVILVSHRASSLGIADEIISMKEGGAADGYSEKACGRKGDPICHDNPLLPGAEALPPAGDAVRRMRRAAELCGRPH